MPSTLHEARLRDLVTELIDQQAARVIVPPYHDAPGSWFGGGNVVKDREGTLWLAGRYRNAGDSRTGLELGERGLELALYASRDGGVSFEKVRGWGKAELGPGVLSIEGSALHAMPDGRWELFVSSEKAVAYPDEVAEYQKPGTGLWSIDVMRGDSIEGLDAAAIEPVFIETPGAGYLHVKDSVVFDREDGDTVLAFCSHPYCWTSSNSGYAVRPRGDQQFTVASWEMVGRGPAWDVAGTRVTSRLAVPRVGVFRTAPPVSVYFYDGLECVRCLDENPRAVSRPRGYSCEELGGACWGYDTAFPAMTRLSERRPLFVSPYGTGCSRYVDTLVDCDGILATWQQGQEDGSQPLVGRRLDGEAIERMLR